MVQIIAGKKGKGKTKHLLDMANAASRGLTEQSYILIRVLSICMS